MLLCNCLSDPNNSLDMIFERSGGGELLASTKPTGMRFEVMIRSFYLESSVLGSKLAERTVQQFANGY